MAAVLDVSRTKANEGLGEVMFHGIVFKVKRGVYQFNPPYSYRVAEFIPGTETTPAEYVKVDQHATIAKIRSDQSLPDLVRFPSFEKMREKIERLRKERAEQPEQRRRDRRAGDRSVIRRRATSPRFPGRTDVITSRLHPLCAVAASAALLLTGCSGGAADDKPAHPVFDVPVGQQPHQALLATQAARSAAFTQTLTFSSPSGDTVQTTSGRLDFPGGRAVGSIDWAPAEKLPQQAQDTLLGTRLAGRAPTRTRLAVDPGTIRLRAGEARYWLLYEGNSGAIAPGAAVDTLRGSEAAFGGTLLEVLSAAEDVKEAPAKKGGRVYRAELSQTYALRLFPKDLGSELAISMDANGDVPFVPLSISVDAKGRVLRAEADLSALLARKDSALKGMTGLRARLDLTGFGVSAPVMPAASEPALDAKKAVTKVAKVKKGVCRPRHRHPHLRHGGLPSLRAASRHPRLRSRAVRRHVSGQGRGEADGR